MLQALRDRTQSTGFKIIVAVLVFALAFFGFGAFNVFAPGDPEIASVNGEEITQGMVEVETERQRRRILLELGDDANPDSLDTLALQQFALEQLIGRKLLEQAADDLGLRASQSQVNQAVTGNVNFQIDGKFNESLYRRGVQALGYSPPQYLEQMETLLSADQLRTAIEGTATAPLWETRLLNGLMNQRRDIAYLPFTIASFSDGIEIAAEDVQAYYDEHHAEFMTEETVDAAYVQLNWEALRDDPSIEIDNDQLLAEYETDKANAGSEERRRASHILLATGDERSEEQAEQQLRDFRERIVAGESFAELAREHSDDPGSAVSGGDLGSNGKGIFVPEFEDALWGLAEQGELSQPVKTQFGYHLIRLDGIEIQPFPTFEELAADIEERLRENAARELFKERLRELDNLAFELNDALDEVAETLGLELRRTAGVTRASGAELFDHAELRNALFEVDVLEDGNNTPALEYEDGQAVVARVQESYPPVLKPFEDVRETIEEQLVAREARTALLAAQSEALQRIQDGDSVTDVAAEHGLAWESFELVSRGGGPAPQSVLAAAFALPRPPEGGRSVGEASLDEEGEALVTVTRVVDGNLAELSDNELDTMRDYFATRNGRLEFGALRRALNANATIERP